jgi:cytochrome c-type biogenesis protein
MLKQASLPAPLSALSTGQRLLVALFIVVVIFLIAGTLNQPSSTSEFAFGIQSQPFHILAILAFGGGLLSFASPCTLPILTAYFAFAFQSSRKQIATNTVAFMLGLGTTFSLLGAVGFALGRVLRQNERLLLLVGGSFILVFGVMNLLGKGFSGLQQTGNSQQQNSGLRSSYLFGLTFAVGWSSCVGPILGSVFTLAAQTTSVWNGMMLLFIYTLGLGLPLIIVSTFFGRMNRQSIFWRILRGRGWSWNTHYLVVALTWALVIWGILLASTQYAMRRFAFLDGREFSSGTAVVLLLGVIVGSLLWVYSGRIRQVTLYLHSTQLISGLLFIAIGALMLSGKLTTFNSLIPADLAIWFIEIEEKLVTLFS